MVNFTHEYLCYPIIFCNSFFLNFEFPSLIFFFDLFSDVHSNRKMLSRLLQLQSVESDMACDGSEAVQMVKSSPGKYDMIFMDNLMPNMVRYPLQK